ncbi:MAG: LamG domain-containing protein, partial [Phycisphaerales bacterium]|nr:LamG domain-containing protein [Phycisphaerales bacterium]
DPAGGTNACSLTDNAAGSVEQLVQDVTVAADSTTWTATVWVRCPTTTQTVGLGMDLFGFANNIVTATCSPTWTRLVSSQANNGAITTARIHLYPTDTTAASEGTAQFWRPQIYNKAFAVPLDPAVAGTAVTTNLDALSYSQAHPGDKGAVSAWVRWNGTGVNHTITMWDSTHDFEFILASTGALRLRSLSLANNVDVVASTTLAVETWGFVTATWDQTTSTARLFLNGVEVSYSSQDQTWTSGGTFGSALSVGGASGATTMHGFISDLRVFNQALSPQQVRASFNAKSTLYATRDETPREKLRRTVMLASARLENPFAFFSPFFDERARHAEDVATAKRVVASPTFPQPALVSP